MKKILAILLAGMMTATVFAGCGGGGNTESGGSGSDTQSSSDDGGAEVKDANLVDVSVFGDEDNISLKVWAPDKAVSLVKEQIEAFKAAYPEKTFTKIEVVAQGEGDAGTQLMNDASTAADVFSFASDQLNKLVDAKVIAPVAFAKAVTDMNSEACVTAGTLQDTLYAYPETNDNGYYLVYDKTVVSDEQAGKLEDVLAACKEAGKKFIFNCGNGFYGCTFAFTAGVKIDGLEEDGVTQKFTDYDEAEAVKTLQAFSKLM
ncbi:MAG: extracellular solute-binding protein, partial [Ruminococcus sp.]|nr:extracellular solute-binding protein [Ruminococcus sp.]